MVTLSRDPKVSGSGGPPPPGARPTAIGDQPVYSVTWWKKDGHQARVHGAVGRHARVTLCAVDFIDIQNPYTEAAINCRVCLARLGNPYRTLV
jgi:hypothetical protein